MKLLGKNLLLGINWANKLISVMDLEVSQKKAQLNSGTLVELIDDIITYDNSGITRVIKKGSLGVIVDKLKNETADSLAGCDWIKSSVGPFWEVMFNNRTVLCSQREIKIINNV